MSSPALCKWVSLAVLSKAIRCVRSSRLSFVSLYIYVSVCKGVNIHTHVQVPTGAKRVSDPLESELEAVVNP